MMIDCTLSGSCPVEDARGSARRYWSFRRRSATKSMLFVGLIDR
jgi:hypothetical protein